jgi:hypothetical protein
MAIRNLQKSSTLPSLAPDSQADPDFAVVR